MSASLKYQEIANEIEQAIASGRLKAGHRLPSVREVMKQYGVSLATAVTAYRKLEESGLTEARPKKGYYVLEHRKPQPSSSAVNSGNGGVVVDCVEALASSGLFPQQRLQRLMASAVRQFPNLSITPGSLRGHEKLRVEIARRCAEYGLFVRGEEVVVTQGAWEALRLSLQAVSQPGDTVVVESPCHPRFFDLLSALGLSVIELEICAGAAPFWQCLEQALDSQDNISAVLIMPTFHPATGGLMSIADKRRLMSLCESRQLAVIEFDAMGDLQFEGPRPPPVKAFDQHGWVIYCGSFSNIVAPGLPVGWAAPGRWADAFQQLKRSTGASQCELPQVVIHEYLKGGSHRPQLRRMRQVLQERMQQVGQLLKDAMPEGSQWTLPQGAYYLWLQLPVHLSERQLNQVLNGNSRIFAPGTSFSRQPRYGHCVRLNVVGAPPEQLELAIRELGQACRTLAA